MSDLPVKDFNVAVVGGGMCGLAAAYGLARAGVSVEVFESAAKLGEVGAGVGIGPNGVRALDGLGLLPAVLARSDQAEPVTRIFQFISGFDPHELVFDYKTSMTNPEQHRGIGIYRPAFVDAVEELLDPTIIHFHKRCTGLSTSQSGRTLVHFSDGTTYEADVVIGADGIRSVSRDFVTGQDSARSLVFANTVAYRGLAPHEDLVRAGIKTELSKRPICFIGHGRHIICFPINDGRLINFVAFVADHDKPKGSELPLPWVKSVPHEELKEHYVGWGPDPQIILDHLKNSSKWSIHACIPPLKSYVRDRVVLVGDAAHGMLPHLGAGVGQGFEDVYTLIELLKHPQTNKSNMDRVLQVYNIVRPPRANSVLAGSTRAGEIYDSFDPSNFDVSTFAERLKGQWEPVWTYDVRKEAASCIQRLCDEGIFAA
ncbi:salicylate hydroxylase [Moniliophthora roreri MCA 2997]|uniref:Salicylate hydroxylase n=1 Tax=Moniliophthora roreri (strain MCA 2997) TaxID=1381753 RepID=V2WZ70_MONRO|nr:salicylate hydroxylase [Moniliophthora roreri MCA 2997]